MADSQFDILIRILAQQVGNEKAADILKKVREESTLTGKEGVKQEEAVAEATKKTTSSKKQLKDMVKGVGVEFPLLGRLGQLALNPLTMLVSSIVAGFGLWTNRVRELTRAMGGIEMPDVKTTDVERIDAMARAWGTLAEKMAAAATATKSIRADYAATIKLIESNDKFLTALGMDTGNAATVQKAGVAAAAADALELDAKARLARAGTPGSVEAEAAMAKKFADDVAAASAEKDVIKARINDIIDTRDLGQGILSTDNIAAGARYTLRYGNMLPDDALTVEQASLAGQQAIIDRGGQFEFSRRSRAVRRSEVADATKDLDEVDRLRAENRDLRQQAATFSAGAGAKLISSGASGFGDIAGMAQSASNLAQGVAMVAKAIAEMNQANAEIRRSINNLSQRP